MPTAPPVRSGRGLRAGWVDAGQDASASEAADGIKAIYRMLRTERETA